jgi:DNA-binding NtrC family response regulator
MEQAGAISLALVDMVMPNLSGRALVQRLREVQPGLPVVFCSGYDPETDPSELAAFQNLPFIQKPYDANQLLRTVRQALDLHAGVLEPVSSF